MDNRAYAAGYAWSKDMAEAPSRTWQFRDEKIVMPAGSVKEIKHNGYHCFLAKWDDVMAAHVSGNNNG